MWILDPLSIATGGYVGIGPTASDFCPLPLAIATDGYVRFDVRDIDPSLLGGGHGNVTFRPRRRRDTDELTQNEDAELAVLAIIAISEIEQ